MSDYKEIAREARKTVLRLIYKAQTSHIGSNFSCIDILTVLFEKMDLDKDRFVLSKGWAAASLYYFLWRKGRITEEELNSYCQPGSKWIGLAEPVCKDIMIAGGSMGIGLPGAVGLALAKKLKGEDGKVYCLMSDGELQCGTTWESYLIAAQHKLDNLIVLVDFNKLQAMGRVADILKLPRIPANVYGWDFCGWPLDGSLGNKHFEYIEKSLIFPPDEKSVYRKGIPIMIIYHTIKGQGWKRAENNNLYHYKQLSTEEYQEALAELNKWEK